MSALLDEVPLVRCELKFNGNPLMSFAVHTTPTTDDDLVELLQQMISMVKSPKTEYHD